MSVSLADDAALKKKEEEEIKEISRFVFEAVSDAQFTVKLERVEAADTRG